MPATRILAVSMLLGAALVQIGCDRGDSDAPDDATGPVAPPDQTDDRPTLSAPDVDREARSRLLTLPYAAEVEDEDPGESVDTGVILHNREKAWPGYNLYVAYATCRADLLDMDGNVVHYWTADDCHRWVNMELLPNGDLLIIGVDEEHTPGPEVPDDKRYLLRLSWDGNVVFKKYLRAHHDVELTPAGQIALLTFQRTKVSAVSEQIDTRDDQVTLLTPEGDEIASMSLVNVLRQQPREFPLQRVKVTGPKLNPWMDIFHCNSVEFMHQPELESRSPIYAAGNVLLCSRHQDRIFIVNFASNDLLWSWGLGEISGPHDARLLPTGNILLFDNGVGRGYSRLLEVDPLTNQIVWQYVADPPQSFYTVTKGSNQRLPNGNTLAAHSDEGEAFEITRDGEMVWQFRTPYRKESGKRGVVARIRRYPAEMIEAFLRPEKSRP